MRQTKPRDTAASFDATSSQPGLEWLESLLGAITAVQQQLHVGARHSDSIATILNTALALTGARSGMLANVMADEPCRLNDMLAAGVARDEALVAFDELARAALDCGHYVTSDGDLNAVALPLALGAEVHGVLVLAHRREPFTRQMLDTLAPFTNCAASVLRQFQDDLSDSQVGAFIDHLAEGILTFDEGGVIEAVNAAAEQVFGYAAEDVVGRSLTALLAEPFAAAQAQSLHANGVVRVSGFDELEGRRKDGTVFPMDLSVSDIEVRGRRVHIGIVRDMTDYKARRQMVEAQRATTQTLELLVRSDTVTGIANRRHFDEKLENEVRRAARERQPLGLVLCDIDFFKSFNDRYGHLAGDKALRSVAQAIDGCFQRAGELAARYGGEEFGVVIAGADVASAMGLARKVRARIGELSIPHTASPIADHVTVSIGVASVVPGPRFDPRELVEAADRALYRAKGSGRDRIYAASGSDGGGFELRAV